MDVLGSPSLIVSTVSVDTVSLRGWTTNEPLRNVHSSGILWRGSELRSCVKVEVDVLGSPSLIVRTVSVDVEQHWRRRRRRSKAHRKAENC